MKKYKELLEAGHWGVLRQLGIKDWKRYSRYSKYGHADLWRKNILEWYNEPAHKEDHPDFKYTNKGITSNPDSITKISEYVCIDNTIRENIEKYLDSASTEQTTRYKKALQSDSFTELKEIILELKENFISMINN